MDARVSALEVFLTAIHSTIVEAVNSSIQIAVSDVLEAKLPIHLASFHLDGEALQWFKWMDCINTTTRYDEFTRAFCREFGPSEFNNSAESLFKLRQTSTLRDYIVEFRRLANRTTDLGPILLKICFLGGFKRKLKFNVKLLKPATVHDAIAIAVQLDTKITELKSNSPGPVVTIKPQTIGVNPHIVPRAGTLPIKKLSLAKIQLKMKRGECWFCSDKWVKGHKCGLKQLLMIEDLEPRLLEEFVEDVKPELQSMELSECAFYGINARHNVHTMKVNGTTNGQTIRILLDSGSCEVVLGVHWLSTVSLALWDFQLFTMEFTKNQKKYKLSHSPYAEPFIQEVSLHHVDKDLCKSHLGLFMYFIEDQPEYSNALTPVQLQDLQHLTAAFEELKFIPRYSGIYQPLYQLTKKDGFHWNKEATATFEQLKATMASPQDNVVTNALSRVHGESVKDDFGTLSLLECFSILYPYRGWLDELRRYNEHDAWVIKKTKEVFNQLHSNIDSSSLAKFSFMNGLLSYKGRIVLSHFSEWRHRLLEEFHLTFTSGHQGVTKNYHRLKKQLYWQGMKRDVKQFIANYHICQQYKYETTSPAGLLKPLSIPNRVWTDISMDFIMGLPFCKGKSMTMVVVNRLSKYPNFVAFSHSYSTTSVAQSFVDNIFKLHGMPQSIVSDSDPFS
ncbi:uncharacterized protein [Pyrus communis]|uniref:uncharacterized protein n=1 Tax=Pyrus communis TaxID=23211 RepID=UPI0035BECAB2